MGFRLQQKSITLNDLERQFAALLSVFACCEARITRFSLLTLYLSYLHIKFDNEIKQDPFEFQA